MKPTSTAVATTRPSPLTKEMMDRANSGDPAALASLRKYLDDNPDLCQKVGNLTAHRLESLLRQLGDGSPQAALIAESVRRELARLRKSLLPDNPLPVHELAVDRIVLAHLEMLTLDARQPKLTDSSVRIAVAFQRARDAAQRRYLAAMKSLAVLVRLMQGKSTRPKSMTKSLSAPTIKLARLQS